jgi:hypothetical protein
VSDLLSRPCTAFHGDRLLSAGPLIEIALAVKTATDSGAPGTVLTFDDATGAIVDLDLRGSETDIIARLSERSVEATADPGTSHAASRGDDDGARGAPRGRGRPKLGVVAREVTLLPRHWDWLATQPGGASVMLRRLVDEARRTGAGQRRDRAAQEITYRFMSAMAGDLPGFEEATRALFAGNRQNFERHIAAWSADLRDYTLKLASGIRTPMAGSEGSGT